MVLVKFGFHALSVETRNSYIMYGKKYSDDLAVYVRCRDGRPVGGNVKVDYYFSPIFAPDDSIIDFGIGVRINILDQYDMNDEIMIGTGEKIVSLIKYMGEIEQFTLSEINNPFIQSRLFSKYIKAKRMYDSLIHNDKYASEFKELIKALYGKSKQNNAAVRFQMCIDFLNSLPGCFFDQDIELMETKEKANLLIEEIHNRSLLE